MCKVMEDMRNTTLREAMKATVLRMLNAGKYSIVEIAEISGLSQEEVKRLSENKTA